MMPASPSSRRTSRAPKRATFSGSKRAKAARYASRLWSTVRHESPACAPSRTRNSNCLRSSWTGVPHSRSWYAIIWGSFEGHSHDFFAGIAPPSFSTLMCPRGRAALGRPSVRTGNSSLAVLIPAAGEPNLFARRTPGVPRAVGFSGRPTLIRSTFARLPVARRRDDRAARGRLGVARAPRGAQPRPRRALRGHGGARGVPQRAHHGEALPSLRQHHAVAVLG